MKIDPERYRVRAGARVKLKQWPTRVAPFYASKADYQERLERHVRQMAELQNLLYADDRHSLLLIFQAMDAAGKDSCIRHVMSGVNPQGCQVYSFKHPSAEELDHDFLWRCMRALPERGRIGIFNRSYYEEVLIVRVHPAILEAQKLAQGPPDEVWQDRYRSIAGMEAHLERNGTRVVKFFLHISRDEQRKRFLARIDEPEKNWKFSSRDVDERKHWKDYLRAYEDCLAATSTRRSPWYVVPADDKPNARLLVSRIIVQTLKDLDLRYPKPDPARRRELARMRRLLAR